MKPCDAHLHLHFPELEKIDLEVYLESVSSVVVNGTSPQDWQAVAKLAREHPEQIIPQFGVHPWEVSKLTKNWQEELCDLLEQFPTAGVGEIGLDKWVKGFDLPLQKEIFQAQIQIVNKYRRPATIHCLKAWGTLREILHKTPCEQPFLLHAYGGPADWLPEFYELGAYFSFSPYYLHSRKSERVDAFRLVPQDRLLIETDSPSMLGPQSTWSKEQQAFSEDLQHPLNLIPIYKQAAHALGLTLEKLLEVSASNFQKIFIISVG